MHFDYKNRNIKNLITIETNEEKKSSDKILLQERASLKIYKGFHRVWQPDLTLRQFLTTLRVIILEILVVKKNLICFILYNKTISFHDHTVVILRVTKH